MEYEIRYYYPKGSLAGILNTLKMQKEIVFNDKYYEKTIQYNHPMEKYNFYSEKIDGRFRIRISKSSKHNLCKLSWKRRLSDTITSDVNKEEEYEVNFDSMDYNNLLYLIENVIHMNCVESYERYRTIYENNEVEIAIDEYPFGIAIEIEAKKNVKTPKKVVDFWSKKLAFDEKRKYRLSWDDKYQELCNQQNKIVYNEVLFEKEMPEII